MRVIRSSSAPPVCPWPSQRLGRLSQSPRPGSGLRVDPPSGCVSRPLLPLASDGGFVRDVPQPPPTGLLFTNGGPTGGGSRCSYPILGQSAGICISSFRPAPESLQQGSGFSQLGAHTHRSLLASPSLVCRSPRSVSGGPGPSSSTSRPSSSASLPPLSREPPRAQADWVSHCQRSARHFGFSAGVARQLAFSRRSSTRLNYQSK